jgi:hypothetical protein
MKKIIIITLAVFTILSSCKKTTSSSDPVYTFKGTLYKDCSKTILANTPVALYDPIIYGGLGLPYSGPTILGADTTDANGNFTISYKITTGFFPFAQFLVNGSAVMEDIRTGTNLDGIAIYKKASNPIIVKFNVTKAYTSTDTITINDIRTYSSNLKIAGPFINNAVAYSIASYPILLPKYAPDTCRNIQNLGYQVNQKNQNDWNIVSKYRCPCEAVEFVLDIK